MRAFLVILAAGLLACTPVGQLAAVHEGLDVALCVAEHQDKPLEAVVAQCIRENVTPTDIASILARQRSLTERSATARSCPKN